jgi:hypothetical protein
MLPATAKRSNARLHATTALRLAVPTALCLGVLALSRPAVAVPSFAEQTGMACQACHVGGFGPQLTTFGREFKLNGYTLKAKKFYVPIAAMAIGSFTHTKADQVPPPDPSLKPNDNFTFDQGSLFVGGSIGEHVGGLAQVTYNGISKTWSWDNLDVRVINKGKLFGHDATYGIDVNNNPTAQDAWNTTPAWGFPYTGGAVAQGPSASALIDGSLAQGVIGATAYAWIDHHLYLEAGGYSTPAAGTLQWLGADPIGVGDIHGLAPYGRAVWQQDLGPGTFHIGAFALKAAINPGRDRTTGMTDHYTDVGFDSSYIVPRANGDTFMLQARYTHESEDLAATCLLNALPANCAQTRLGELKGDVSYYWRGKVGVTVSAFTVTGPSNVFLYSGPFARPDSNGVMGQIDYTPWGSGNGPLGPYVNVRFGVQYTAYGQFNGTRHNFDGNDANASDNNSLRLYTWVAF